MFKKWKSENSLKTQKEKKKEINKIKNEKKKVKIPWPADSVSLNIAWLIFIKWYQCVL